MIRAATEADIPALATIHARALPDDLLPRLGVDFLRDVFYPTALRLTGVSVWVATDAADTPIAFVVFAEDADSLTAQLRRRWPAVLRATAKRTVSDPGLLVALAAVAKAPEVVWGRDAPPSMAKAPELYVIATDPAAQGQGAGSELTRHGVKDLASRGHRDCIVRTSSPDALRFYQRLGFRTVGHERRGRRRLDLLHVTAADVRT